MKTSKEAQILLLEIPLCLQQGRQLVTELMISFVVASLAANTTLYETTVAFILLCPFICSQLLNTAVDQSLLAFQRQINKFQPLADLSISKAASILQPITYFE